MKNDIKIFAAVIISLVAIMPVSAKVFESTYEVSQSDNDDLMTEKLVGKGVNHRPRGARIKESWDYQLGFYKNLESSAFTGFTNGVILSTGKITDGASLENRYAVYPTGPSGWQEALPNHNDPVIDCDTDLENCFGRVLSDPAGLVLFVQPRNKTLNIPFLLASEEYYRQTKAPTLESPSLDAYKGRSDAFAVFIEEIALASDETAYDEDGNVKDPNLPMTDNYAKLPDGSNVEIASVNQHSNAEYFVSNVVANEKGRLVFPTNDIAMPMEFNGAIVGLVAIRENVDPSKIYKIKIVVGDSYDNVGNTVVFLQEGGVTSGADLQIDVSGPASISEAGAVTFTNTVSNIGPATADGVVVTNYLPVGVNWADVGEEKVKYLVGSITGNGKIDGRDYFVWTIGDGFAPGSNAVMRIECDLKTAGNTYTNSANVITSTGDYDEDNNKGEWSTVVAAPDTTALEFVVDKLTKMYDGADLLPTYSYTTNALAPGHKLTEVVFDVASIRDVGKTNVNIISFTVKDGDTVVTDKYTPAYVQGSLEVTKRKVTLTSFGDEKVYDGGALTNHETPAVGEDGFADGEGVETYTFTGSQTTIGESDNEFTFELKGGTKDGNYDIEPSYGRLKVYRVETPIAIKVEGASRKYDGTPLTTATDAKCVFTEGVLVAGDELVATLSDATITDVGSVEVAVSEYKVMRGETDVTDCYTFGDSVPGTLEVTKRKVTLTSHGGKKPYDRTALTNHDDPDIGGDGFADEEGVKEYTFTGSQTIVGTSANEFTYELKDNTKAGNYEIERFFGTLEVTKVTSEAKITVDNLSKQYDKKPLIATYQTEGILSGDELQVTLDVASITAVGSTEVNVIGKKVLRGEDDVTADYTFEVIPGSLEVTKRPLTVAARNNTKKYGTPTAFSGKEYTVTGGKLLAGDTITQVVLACKGCDKTAQYNEDGYPIEVKKVMGNGLENYDITTEDGVLKIVKLPLTITANDTNKVYGTEVKFSGTEFKVTSGVLVNGDTVTNVTLTSEGAAKNAAWLKGGYDIVAGYPVDGKGAGNYDIAFLPGTLTVDKRKITITAGDTNKVYGTEIELDRTAFEITEGELADGDSVTNVTLTSEGTVSNAVCLKDGEGYPIIPSHVILGEIETNNYEIAFSNGTLTVDKADLTITVNEAKWRVGKPKPVYRVADFSSQLKAGDTCDQITEGAEFTAEAYSNKVFEAVKPTKLDKGEWKDEIWLKRTVLTGERASNYDISIEPGTLTVASAEAKFSVTLEGHENGWTGVEELTLKVTNEGDDQIDPEYDYWVELMPKTNAAGEVVYCICNGIGSDRKPIRTEQRPDGCDYKDLTAAVKAALDDGTFDRGDTVTITGISFFHSGVGEARHSLESFIGKNPTSFFMAGELFCPSDTNRDFVVSVDEKLAAKDLLGENSADYLEVTRLSCLLHYHWDAKEANWIGPPKPSMDE